MNTPATNKKPCPKEITNEFLVVVHRPIFLLPPTKLPLLLQRSRKVQERPWQRNRKFTGFRKLTTKKNTTQKEIFFVLCFVVDRKNPALYELLCTVILFWTYLGELGECFCSFLVAVKVFKNVEIDYFLFRYLWTLPEFFTLKVLIGWNLVALLLLEVV